MVEGFDGFGAVHTQKETDQHRSTYFYGLFFVCQTQAVHNISFIMIYHIITFV